MNPYQVIYEPTAWNSLRTKWKRSKNKRALKQATKEIEQALGSDPHGNGIPLSEGLFKFSFSPLLVCYSIDSPKMQVVISHVYEIP
jgi:hypothetical protein